MILQGVKIISAAPILSVDPIITMWSQLLAGWHHAAAKVEPGWTFWTEYPAGHSTALPDWLHWNMYVSGHCLWNKLHLCMFLFFWIICTVCIWCMLIFGKEKKWEQFRRKACPGSALGLRVVFECNFYLIKHVLSLCLHRFAGFYFSYCLPYLLLSFLSAFMISFYYS